MTMSTSERQLNRRDEHLTDAELNELVDGTLAARDLTRAQTHLDACQECDERYRSLLATVSALKSAPALMPRRSFQLSPEQAKLPAKTELGRPICRVDRSRHSRDQGRDDRGGPAAHLSDRLRRPYQSERPG